MVCGGESVGKKRRIRKRREERETQKNIKV
jgi:hypothetical protein